MHCCLPGRQQRLLAAGAGGGYQAMPCNLPAWKTAVAVAFVCWLHRLGDLSLALPCTLDAPLERLLPPASAVHLLSVWCCRERERPVEDGRRERERRTSEGRGDRDRCAPATPAVPCRLPAAPLPAHQPF